MGLRKFWNSLNPFEKWLAILFPPMFLGIALMRISYSDEEGLGVLGLTGFSMTSMSLLILLFVAVPLAIRRRINKWRKERKSRKE